MDSHMESPRLLERGEIGYVRVRIGGEGRLRRTAYQGKPLEATPNPTHQKQI